MPDRGVHPAVRASKYLHGAKLGRLRTIPRRLVRSVALLPHSSLAPRRPAWYMRNTPLCSPNCCSCSTTRASRAPSFCPRALPAHGAAATRRLVRCWRPPCTALRASLMAVEAAVNCGALSSSRASISAVATEPASSYVKTEPSDRATSRYAARSMLSYAATAVSEAVTAPRPESAAGPSADESDTGHVCRDHSLGSGHQLPSSHSPALKFEVSFWLR